MIPIALINGGMHIVERLYMHVTNNTQMSLLIGPNDIARYNVT